MKNMKKQKQKQLTNTVTLKNHELWHH